MKTWKLGLIAATFNFMAILRFFYIGVHEQFGKFIFLLNIMSFITCSYITIDDYHDNF